MIRKHKYRLLRDYISKELYYLHDIIGINDGAYNTMRLNLLVEKMDGKMDVISTYQIESVDKNTINRKCKFDEYFEGYFLDKVFKAGIHYYGVIESNVESRDDSFTFILREISTIIMDHDRKSEERLEKLENLSN